MERHKGGSGQPAQVLHWNLLSLLVRGNFIFCTTMKQVGQHLQQKQTKRDGGNKTIKALRVMERHTGR